jgi:hypothetical protein
MCRRRSTIGYLIQLNAESQPQYRPFGSQDPKDFLAGPVEFRAQQLRQFGTCSWRTTFQSEGDLRPLSGLHRINRTTGLREPEGEVGLSSESIDHWCATGPGYSL